MGDPELRRIIDEACAADDESTRRDEISDYELEQKIQRYQQTLKQRSGNDSGLIYGRDDARVSPSPVQQPQQQYMAENQQVLWDRWCDSRVRKFLHDEFKEPLAEFVSTYVNQRLTAERDDVLDAMCEVAGSELGCAERRLLDKIEKLEKEVAALRCDLAIETGVRKQQVVDLPRFIRKDGTHG